MIKVNPKLKCVFNNIRNDEVFNDYTEKYVRRDMLVYFVFKGDEMQDLKTGEYDLLHLDGDTNNCELDNLELVVFEDETPAILQLEEKIKWLKNELILKNEQIKNLTLENNIKDGRFANMQKQIDYEQNRVKKLNKELKIQESEIRRLLKIIDSNIR